MIIFVNAEQRSASGSVICDKITQIKKSETFGTLCL